MAKVNFIHFVPRPKPKKRPGRIRKKYGPGVKRPKKYKGQGR